MKNINADQIFKVLGVLFIISIVYTVITMYPHYGSSFDKGFSTGSAFGQAIKVLGAIGLITYGIRTIRRRGVKTLN